MAIVLGARARDKYRNLPRTALGKFPFRERNGTYHPPFSALCASVLPRSFRRVVAPNSLAEPRHSMAIVQPAIFRSRIRPWHGLAFRLRRLLYL
jgi:hypothetical protein